MLSKTFIFAASSIFVLSLAAPHPHYLTDITPSSVVARKAYTMFIGDGSISQGWPKRSEWMPFETAWNANLQVIQQSCVNNGWGMNNDANETETIKYGIREEANTSGIPPEFILAIVMQESGGCVRVHTTQHSGFGNPGLMQSSGIQTCNPDGKPLSPCPAGTIRGMIHDGTAGEGLRTTLKNSADFFSASGVTDDSIWYKTARRYNAGEILMNQKNLGVGPTQCYASDIANRLISPFETSGCNSDAVVRLPARASA